MPVFTRFKFKPINTNLRSVVHHSQYIRTENKPDETTKPIETPAPETPAETQAN